jgi:flagellar protein FliO/FliZ
MVSRKLRWGAAALAAAPLAALAAESAPGPGIGSVVQVSLGLGLVLLMVAGAAWLARRLGVGSARSDGALTVRGGVAVGQRERVVVVEIDDTWLVIGVAPGRISALHTLPKPPDARAPQETAQRPFAQWFKRALEKRRA